MTTWRMAADVPIRNDPSRKTKYPHGITSSAIVILAFPQWTASHDEREYITSPATIMTRARSMVVLYPRAFTNFPPRELFSRYPRKKKNEIIVVSVFRSSSVCERNATFIGPWNCPFTVVRKPTMK